MREYNDMELMLCAASRVLEDNSTVIVGTGAPCASAMLAQKVHAPNLTVLFEAGGIGPQLPTMPISVGDSRTFYRGLMATSMDNIMSMLQRGLIDVCFIGGAQIDMYGNINSTVIGDYKKPKVRLPGSGGANDIATLCWRSLCVTIHSPKRFVEKIDFLTSPGYLTGAGSREKEGIPPNTGPFRVITNLCTMGFNPINKRMTVISIHPGISRKEIIDNTGFELLFDSSLKETSAPTDEELCILREKIDPYRYVIGRSV